MTTNVFDRPKAELTSDSRWSTDNGDLVAFVDDTNYDKIAYTDKAGFVFAGDIGPIESWKQYVAGGMKKGTRPPLAKPSDWVPGNRISLIQVTFATGQYFQSHEMLTSGIAALVRAIYSGTGAPYAKACWDVNRCAQTAIRSAAVKDVRSGGTVKHFNCVTLENNVTNTATVVEVYEQLKDRGYIMNEKQPQAQPILLKDAVMDPHNPAAQAFAKAVLSGSTLLTAPFPDMNKPWTEEKIAEFDSILADLESD